MQDERDDGETLYASARHLFTVRRIESKLVLTAVCGTAGLSIASRELTPDEVAIFYEDPEGLAITARELCDRWASGELS